MQIDFIVKYETAAKSVTHEFNVSIMCGNNKAAVVTKLRDSS